MTTEIPADVTLKILLVDDEVNITRSLWRLLSVAAQYDVISANSGTEALGLVSQNPDIAVIISDQRMPEMTGVEFLAEARKLVPNAVRILLTGYADVEASIGAINKGGVFRYLTKPWKDEDVLQVVAEAAHGYWLVVENQRLSELVAKQNAELQDWNKRLKQRVLEQTAQIRDKSDVIAETHNRLRKTFAEVIEALAGLIEMRDKRSVGHNRNVAELVMAMAVHLGLSDQEREQLRAASLLHDIGKIGISDHLLKKARSELKGEDLKEYQSHSVRGQATIDMVPALRDMGLLIRHHHELYNGRGFPDRLKGDKIPLGARIIGAADLCDRRMAHFPGTDALESTLQSLDNEWGESLDPALRSALEKGARDVFKYLNLSTDLHESKVSPRGLKAGMQLNQDLYSGTGVLLLKKGAIFSDQSIDAVRRCQTIDPFEPEICVIVDSSIS